MVARPASFHPTDGKWDGRMVLIAYAVAEWSKDPKEKVGAVLASPDRRQVSWGYNGFPAGIDDAEYRLKSDEERVALSVHAELNATLNSAVPVRGWTLYVTKHPCAECAKAIIQAGVIRVVCPVMPPKSKWWESMKRAQNLFQEARVRLDHKAGGLDVG